MKSTEKIRNQSISRPVSKKYGSVDEFVAAKVKEATESLRKVDLSILRK